MIIEPFRIKVTPEQSKIVQETLFKNGYKWASDKEIVDYTDKGTLCLDNNKLYWRWNDEDEKTIPIITFEEFKQRYIMNTEEKIVQLEKELQQLKEEVKKEKTEFKEGEWLYAKTTSSEVIFRYLSKTSTHFTTKEGYQVGVNFVTIQDTYTDTYANINERHITKATDEQVLRILSKVAEHKGFKEGVRIKWICGLVGDTSDRLQGKLKYSSSDDSLEFECKSEINTIYSQGKWAEIVKETPIKISGYEAKFDKKEKTVKFGCKTITLSQLKSVIEIMKLNEQFDEGFVIEDTQIFQDNNSDFSEIISKVTIEKLIKELES